MDIKLKPLTEQVIVITGASSGIGLVTARAAAAAGARVLLVARNGSALQEAAEAIRAAGGEADHAVADVGNIDEVRAAAAKAIERFGRIDGWVNNAGVAIYAKLVNTPLDEHERMVRTNYFGVVNGATVAVEHLRAGGGALVTVGSIASDLPSPVMGAYAATKHAAKAYIEALRMELRADELPIAVTIIKPSGIDTPIAQHAANHSGEPARIPPPVYDPSLVADAILAALTRPSRDITVGGAGRAQVLAGTHFPRLRDLITSRTTRAITDDAHKQAEQGSLFEPGDGGRERSGVQNGRRISLYTGAQLHRGWVAAAGAGLGLALVGGIAAARRRRD